MNKYKAIIFDLDGTLLDTIEDIANACNLALRGLQLKEYSLSDYKLFVGDGVDQLIERTISHQNANILLFDELKSRYLSNYHEASSVHTKPYPGIIELLSYAKNNNVTLAVLSNKPDKDTLNVIKHYFGDYLFDKVYGKVEGYLPKPDPTKLNELINELKIPKENILYIGDTLTDMQTAQNGGLTKCAVLWGFRGIEELSKLSPEYIVSSPFEIIQILKKV